MRLIPHGLSALRLVLAYPFFRAMGDEAPTVAFGAALLFATAVVTDIADGRLARRLGTASSRGRLLDHTADFVFVVLGLFGAALRGAFTLWLPVLVAAAFLQYVGDSFLVHERSGLQMSSLGRWNGILYFVPVAGDILVRLGLSALVPAVRLVAAALVVTTLLSMGERALALIRSRRRAPGSPSAEREGRSPR